MPSDISDSRRLDYEQNVQDAIAILPQLQTGIDVNVRFTGVSLESLNIPKKYSVSSKSNAPILTL